MSTQTSRYYLVHLCHLKGEIERKACLVLLEEQAHLVALDGQRIVVLALPKRSRTHTLRPGGLPGKGVNQRVPTSKLAAGLPWPTASDLPPSKTRREALGDVCPCRHHKCPPPRDKVVFRLI